MKIELLKPCHFKAVESLETNVWGSEGADLSIIKSRYKTFPEGNVIVIHQEKIVGYAAVQRVSRMSCHNWDIQTDNGFIKRTHKPDGHIIYGIGMSGVKNGVSNLIIDYFYDKFISSGTCYMLALGSRVPGFKGWKFKTGGDITQYINSRRKNGFSLDPELYLYQKNGFEVLCEMENYFPCVDSENNGALIIRR
ncbi:hypothetical protein [Marinomonas aquiplantarum]|uniref:N-acetyltransferase domain-containing protein n=1 Tax=Marinomonas aquiplantarum TaxID=491951 RepID=A0A366CXH5_9GAMM|nr:hypothetical protein [Marinomonas aquiplantarum]RBO82540.1 hypothetical protein DFP76_1054 [Marinomonas aquiplantarum]